MEIAKDNIFKIVYDKGKKKDKASWTSRKKDKECWKSRVMKMMKKHKLITTTLIAFAMFSTMNCIMIYNFVRILQNL